MNRFVINMTLDALQLSVLLAWIGLLALVFWILGFENPVRAAAGIGLAAMVILILRDVIRFTVRVYRQVSRLRRGTSGNKWGA